MLYTFEDRQPSVPDGAGCWIAPTAVLVGDARLGRDVSIWFGAIIRADNSPICIGDGSNIQEGAVLHSDPQYPLTIGVDVTVGHRALLHGCTIGDGVLIGMGATVMNGAVIGDGCLVAAGALVPEGRQFPPGTLILGVPAIAKGALDDEAIERLRASAISYVAKKERFMRGFRELA